MAATTVTPAKSSTAAGSVAIALIWILSLFGVIVPADVAVSIAVALIGAAGWAAHRFGPKVALENGGALPPGWTVVRNDTGKVEHVLPPEPPKAGGGV